MRILVNSFIALYQSKQKKSSLVWSLSSGLCIAGCIHSHQHEQVCFILKRSMNAWKSMKIFSRFSDAHGKRKSLENSSFTHTSLTHQHKYEPRLPECVFHLAITFTLTHPFLCRANDVFISIQWRRALIFIFPRKSLERRSARRQVIDKQWEFSHLRFDSAEAFYVYRTRSKKKISLNIWWNVTTKSRWNSLPPQMLPFTLLVTEENAKRLGPFFRLDSLNLIPQEILNILFFRLLNMKRICDGEIKFLKS